MHGAVPSALQGVRHRRLADLLRALERRGRGPPDRGRAAGHRHHLLPPRLQEPWDGSSCRGQLPCSYAVAVRSFFLSFFFYARFSRSTCSLYTSSACQPFRLETEDVVGFLYKSSQTSKHYININNKLVYYKTENVVGFLPPFFFFMFAHMPIFF